MRPRLTEIDYAIIAVAPALIMVLVGSLVLFLTGLFYEGPHSLRLNFILCMFVLGIVSIARISIEQGNARAVPFGVLLGGLVAFAVARFVPEALVLTCILLAILWWVSTRLVYDCTVVAQSVDSSKKGLMQWIRAAEPEEKQPEPASDEIDQHQGLTGREEAAVPAAGWGKFFSWFNPTSTQFAPGAWVVYFSLAALPIFGLGQAFAGNLAPASRWYLFTLLVAYVAAALCLLVTTSFLGLRRYLQQRGVQMPLSMTGTWLGVGFGVVALVLIVVSILPRPNAEYELAQLPFYEDQQSRKASRFAQGKDGTEDQRSDRSRTTSDSEKTSEQTPTSSETRPDGRRPDGAEDPNGEKTTQGESSESGDQSSKDSRQPPSDSEGEQTSQNQEGQKSESQEASDSDSTSQQTQQNDANGAEQAESDESNEGDNKSSNQQDTQSQKQEADQGQQSQDRSAEESNSGSSELPKPSSDSAPPPTPSPSPVDLFSSLGNLLKLLFYAVAIALVVFLVWYFREDLARSWAEFWSSLFGRKRTSPSDKPAEEAKPVRQRQAFSAFVNPFQDPRWKGRPLEEWIRYSFSAVEAWADERGHGRKEEQTPSEFAAMLEHQFVDLNHAVRQAAELYGQVAYGSGKAPGETVEILRNLWQRLRATQPTSRSSNQPDHAPGTHSAKGPS